MKPGGFRTWFTLTLFAFISQAGFAAPAGDAAGPAEGEVVYLQMIENSYGEGCSTARRYVEESIREIAGVTGARVDFDSGFSSSCPLHLDSAR